MNNNFFGRLLEIIWLLVGCVAAIASLNSFMNNDSKNGIIMILCSLVGFLMFFTRRSLRLQRNKKNGKE